MTKQAPPPPPPPSVTAETFTLDAAAGQATSSQSLPDGQTVTVTISGVVSNWVLPLDEGTPQDGGGLDAETIFAWPHQFPHTAGHVTALQMNTGNGYKHVEPTGGPYQIPRSDHTYTYHLTGQGKPLQVQWADSPLADNSGAFTITVA